MSRSDLEAIQEKLLVLRAQAREEKALEQLVAQYERRMLYYIHRILGNDAHLADVMQEVWMRVFLKIGTLRSPEAFRVWLYRIAHDAAVSQLRKGNRLETATLSEEQRGNLMETNELDEFELLDNAELVHNALGSLSLPHREVLTLRFLEALELSEISEVVGCSVGTVKSRLHYAKSAIRELVEATYHD